MLHDTTRKLALGALVAALGSPVASTSASALAQAGRIEQNGCGTVTAAPGWPSRRPQDFTSHVTNPWFPLRTGRTWVLRGRKDGKPTVDTFTVTGRTRRIECVPVRVIRDVLTAHHRKLEVTSDWYTQDRWGNVWYFGENTKEFGPRGRVDTSGSWQAGRNGARPGIFMPAHPTVGRSGYQEFLPGEALDHYRIVSRSASVSVPYGMFHHALLTRETTALEPGAVDHKYYVKGLGQVMEVAVKGPKEVSRLVSVTP